MFTKESLEYWQGRAIRGQFIKPELVLVNILELLLDIKIELQKLNHGK